MRNAIIFGKIMSNNILPDWERVLSSAAHLQRILPDAVLVGGTASALYVEHRLSTDADHILIDLRHRFDEVLAELESVAGWKTTRVQRPVQILGSLNGIETGVRQLIRDEPLETTQIECFGEKITVPTQVEILRIKGVLILKRNATRDYLDFAALADQMGNENVASALQHFDRLYPQPNGESALQQLQIQLANPLPFDLEEVNLPEYKNLDLRWHDWQTVKAVCTNCANIIFDQIIGFDVPNGCMDDSLKEAQKIAGQKDDFKLANISNKKYGGKVLGITEHHVVQSLGKTAVIHRKADLERIPSKDEMVDISYVNGRGKVEPPKSLGICD